MGKMKARHLIRIALVGSLGCIGVMCGILIVRNSTAPHIRALSESVVDLGQMDEGQKVVRDFRFRNEGGKPLIIKKIITSCACTGASIDKSQLAHGEDACLKVSYTGRAVSGQDEVRVFLETNDPANPVVVVAMKCRVLAKVFWRPGTVVLHGDKGKETEQIVKIFTPNPDSFHILHIDKSSDRIRAMCEKGDRCTMCKISSCPGLECGNRTEHVHLEVDIDGYKRSIDIPIYLMIR
jgi:hypothetical protein